jgi:hypothetical protein
VSDDIDWSQSDINSWTRLQYVSLDIDYNGPSRLRDAVSNVIVSPERVNLFAGFLWKLKFCQAGGRKINTRDSRAIHQRRQYSIRR